MSYEEAACLGVAGLTAAMALWKWLEVPGSPNVEKQTIPKSGYILIWGGATVTAHFAIQVAAQGGLEVITVASAQSGPALKKLGASHVISRDGKTCDQIMAEIKSIGGDNITRAIDLVGTITAEFCLRALSTSQRCLFAPLAMISSKTLVPDNIVVETVEMKKFVLEEESAAYSAALNVLVESKRVTLPALEVIHGGLEAIVDGLETIKSNKITGKRVIARM
jgi:NADPH:quinone reductase-like Zn-dependent oxidoreductase